jgi:hypothetical protein
VQVNVAHGGVLVPFVHGVDRFGQFSAAVLVNAAGVDPDIAKSILRSPIASSPEFLKTFFLADVWVESKLLENDR